jgi:hypothetical protein
MDPIVGVIVRNDLLALPSNPRGYIHDYVLPPLTVLQKSGSRNAATPVTSGSAQTGRAPGGTITNVGALTSNLVSFSVTERLKRMTIDESERTMFGSDSEYEAVLSWTGTKQVNDKIETIVYNATAGIAAASCTNVSADIFGGVLAASQQLSAYGPVAIAGGVQAINQLRANPTVIDRMKATGIVLSPTDSVRSISGQQLAAIFEAQDVYEAKTDTVIWAADRIFVYVIPDPGSDPIGTIQVGRRLVYNFVGADGMMQSKTIEMLYDPTVRNNVLDTVVYDQALIYNANYGIALSLDGN